MDYLNSTLASLISIYCPDTEGKEENMKTLRKEKKLLWVKIGFWAGIIADFIFGLKLMFLPKMVELVWGFSHSMSPFEIMWSRYMGAIIFAWTFTLIWGLKKPIERRLLLPITAIFVLIPFIIIECLVLIKGLLPLGNMLFLIGLQLMLIAFFMKGYFSVSE
jgi:hypothetical protein